MTDDNKTAPQGRVVTVAVEAVTVTRWRCPWCRWSWSKRAAASAHAGWCARNPASRACSTCRHFRRQPCCATGSDSCGCMGRNKCTVNGFETWRYNDHATHAPVADGWWTHVVDWRRDCPLWEPAGTGPNLPLSVVVRTITSDSPSTESDLP